MKKFTRQKISLQSIEILSKVVVFDTQEALIDAVEEVKVGTLAYVVSDQMLYIRSAPGWRSITVRH